MGGGVWGDFVVTRVGGVGEVCVVGWLVDGVRVGMGRGGVLEEWNSRSSWRSVWPRSPWEGGLVEVKWNGGGSGTDFCVDVYYDVIASVGHYG